MNRTRFTWLVFISSLVIYGLTVAPSLGTWHSPAWVVNALFFGLPYAPGNLLYLLVSAFFAKVCQWFIEPAGAVNLVSMFSGATATALGFTLIDRMVRKSMPGAETLGGIRWLVAIGALFISALPSIWSSSLVAGPESFNLLLIVLSLWLLFRIQEGSRNSSALIMFWSYLLGLTFSHDYVFIFNIVALILFLSVGSPVLRTLKNNLGPVLFLFVFGTGIYLYLWLRPLLDVGLGQSPEFLSKEFWGYVFNSEALKGSVTRKASFFIYQIPLFLSYLKLQANNWIVLVVALLIFHYGMVRMIPNNKKLLAGVLVLLAVSVIFVLWLDNPRYGPEQALDKVPEPWKHEPIEIDSLFLYSYMLFSSLVITGLCFLWRDSKALLERLMKKIQLDGGKLHGSANKGIFTILLIAPLLGIPMNWQKSDMSGFYTTRDMAENLLVGIEKNAILFVNNDLEYYPTVYMNKAIHKQSDNIIANYMWMADRPYLKDLKRSDPPMPFTFTNTAIDRMRPARLQEAFAVTAGNLQVVYPENTVLNIREQGLLDILRANGFTRPVCFSFKVPQSSLAGLQRYMAVQGLGVRLYEQDPLTAVDSMYFWQPGTGNIAVDIPMTKNLLWSRYRYHTTVNDIKHHPADHSRPLAVYASLHELLGRALLGRENTQEAKVNFQQCEFFSPSYNESLQNFAAAMAWAGDYEISKEFINSYFEYYPADPLKWAGLAKIALANNDSLPATEMLLESIKVDPDFLLGFQKLIRIYDSMKKHVMVEAFLNRWVERHPDDEKATKLWDEYPTTKTLPPEWPE
ncbi:protein O-mannosyl-transferase family [Gemmatimonadota bacterium]